MAETYSTYEAKSRFAEIIRRVRSGRRVIISYRGEPVAEIAPISKETQRLSDSLHALAREGVLVGGAVAPADAVRSWRPIARRAGALRRFLASRSE
jgi:prevent-host-death family protein